MKDLRGPNSWKIGWYEDSSPDPYAMNPQFTDIRFRGTTTRWDNFIQNKSFNRI